MWDILVLLLPQLLLSPLAFFFAGCTCCTPPPTTCNDCCSTVESAETFTVDLGAGGWTDDLCSYCDQVAGEFTLPWLSGCVWRYSASSVCSWDCPSLTGSCAGGINSNFAITATLKLDSSDPKKCYWEVTIVFSFNSDDSCGIDVGDLCCSTALYRTPAADPTVQDCTTTGPWTLEKITEDVNYDCNGNLPATITITLDP